MKLKSGKKFEGTSLQNNRILLVRIHFKPNTCQNQVIKSMEMLIFTNLVTG